MQPIHTSLMFPGRSALLDVGSIGVAPVVSTLIRLGSKQEEGNPT